MDRSAIFVFMHKRIAKFWIVLFHSKKHFFPSVFCISIPLPEKSVKKMHWFPKSFQSPLREYLLSKQCENSNK